MTDGRVLVGVFLCTDRDGNVILGSCNEYLKPEGKRPRRLRCAAFDMHGYTTPYKQSIMKIFIYLMFNCIKTQFCMSEKSLEK
jgi:hypothetical protein